MQNDNHPDSVGEGARPSSKDNGVLRSRLEIYKWLFYAAVFLIVVLIVALCAHQG
jgi:hypothetical protein